MIGRRMTAVACAVGVSLAILIAGCGSSGSSDEAAIEETVKGYFHALAHGDGTTACSQLTGDLARRLFEEGLLQLPELAPTSCATVIEGLAGSVGGDERAALETVEVDRVRVNGSRATATVVGGTQAELEKIDGRWYIAGGFQLAP